MCKRIATSTSVAPDEPSYVLLIGECAHKFMDRYEDVIFEFQRRSRFVMAHSASDAMKGLDQKPQAVFVVDGIILKPGWKSVVKHLVDVRRKGFRLVIGGDYAGMSTRAVDPIFQKLHVPWRFKDYFRTEFELSPSCITPICRTTGLPQTCSLKAGQLCNVAASDALYVARPGAKLQSMVFLDEPMADKAGCPAAYTKLGQGWLGFSGDNNYEGASSKMQLAMCGLTLEDFSLTDQTGTGKPVAVSGSPNATMQFSGVAGIRANSVPNEISACTDVDFWLRPGFRMSNDTTPRQSRWDENRQMQSYPGIPGF